MLNPELAQLIRALEQEAHLISEDRKTELEQFAANLEKMLADTGRARIVFICTHNSRRSQLGQLMLKTAAYRYGIQNIYTFSGGTEATAFNHRMVAAVQRAGFDVQQLNDSDNPEYLIPITPEDQSNDLYFSKKFSDPYNPQLGFIAVMVCTDADEACPFVPGAAARISLPYLDPKAFDDTNEEAAQYDAKLREIGREMLYLVQNINHGQ